jgi:tetratricopeptide (TPR) repeat protein
MAKFINLVQRLLVLALCIGITACASFSIPKQPSDEFIADLLQSNQFEMALTVVEEWQQDNPDNVELKKQRDEIVSAMHDFEERNLAAAKQLDEAGKWQQANGRYQSALLVLPSSESLQEAYEDFHARHLDHIKALKEDLDVAQAKHWLSMRPHIRALKTAAPEDQAANLWQQRSAVEREQLAQRLIEYGLAHEADNHFGTAALRYDLAYQLAPGELTKPYYDRAAKTFAQRKQQQQIRVKEAQERQVSKLQGLAEEFDDYLAQGKFQRAKQTLKAMAVIDAKDPSVLERTQALDKHWDMAVNNAIMEGKQLYTRGEFDSAIRVWKQALELDPDNKEVKENIGRAEKFRDNLERLKQSS